MVHIFQQYNYFKKHKVCQEIKLLNLRSMLLSSSGAISYKPSKLPLTSLFQVTIFKKTSLAIARKKMQHLHIIICNINPYTIYFKIVCKACYLNCSFWQIAFLFLWNYVQAELTQCHISFWTSLNLYLLWLMLPRHCVMEKAPAQYHKWLNMLF